MILLCTDPELIVLLSLVAMLLVACLLVRWRLPGRHRKHRSTGVEQVQM